MVINNCAFMSIKHGINIVDFDKWNKRSDIYNKVLFNFTIKVTLIMIKMATLRSSALLFCSTSCPEWITATVKVISYCGLTRQKVEKLFKTNKWLKEFEIEWHFVPKLRIFDIVCFSIISLAWPKIKLKVIFCLIFSI